MSDASKTRWVVLLQKAPRGPLSRDEVRALIDQGLLRMNDLAMEIPEVMPGSASGKADWKLLWQYPEFNRRTAAQRQPENPADAAAAQAAAETEQRKRNERRGPEISPEEQKRRILENLPPEIAAINAADLAMRSTKTIARDNAEEEARSTPDSETSPSTEPIRWRMFATIGGVAVAAVIAFVTLSSGRGPESAARSNASTATPSRAPVPNRPGMANDPRAMRGRVPPRMVRGRSGLPTGNDLRPFDANARRSPMPSVSPVAQSPDDPSDGDYVAPVRRPRVIRPGSQPVASDDSGDDDDTNQVRGSRRRPARVNRPSIQEEDDSNSNADEEEDPGDAGGDDY